MKVVRRSLLSLFTMKVLLYEFLIASWNPVLESCASTTFKHCKEKLYSSYMNVVTRSILSLFPSNVLLYKIPIASGNIALESCASTTFKHCKEKFYSFIYESYKTFSAIFIHCGSFVIWGFQSRAGISCWNHALAQHSNLFDRRFIHSYRTVVRQSLLSLFTITFCYMRFPIARGNLALEPCASTTFKPCKEKCFS